MNGGIHLEASWRRALEAEFAAPYMAELRDFLMAERLAGKRIFPPAAQWFRALDLTPVDKVRVVILGQDPYHGAGQAHGLCFSVQPDVKIPPSLSNIFKELEADLQIPYASNGSLESWASKGVLLLNSVLTVEEGRPASHKGRGWERFTDAVIGQVAARDQPTVFLLWGRHAQTKASLVDRTRHLVLASAHPSPLSAYGGFFGSRPFSRANAFLEAWGRGAIDWVLPAGS